MTGFDETVPPDLDPDADATSADDVGDNVIEPTGGPVPDSRSSSRAVGGRDNPDGDSRA